MSDKKPISVRIFDCLYWLAIAFIILNNLFKALAFSGLDESWASNAYKLIPTGVWIVTASALWYFASLRKSVIPLIIIFGLVLVNFLIYYQYYPDAAWSLLN